MGRPAIDITGMRFGKVVVIERAISPNGTTNDAYWLCQCDCGVIDKIPGSRLRSSEIKSCGCGAKYKGYKTGGRVAEDLTGQRFGKLVVIHRAVSAIRSNGKPRTQWLCLCDCGRNKIAQATLLKNRHIKSCGCEMKNQPLGIGEYGEIFVSYRLGAGKRNLSFELTTDDVVSLCMQDCHYCGAAPSNVIRRKRARKGNVKLMYNGIDRIDSSKGYAPDNVVPCCRRCNLAKNDMTTEEFIDQCRRIVLRHG